MLVLAIAAVIIVMSVRYYQSASASQRANACLSYLQAVVAAADSLSEATQSYSSITSSELDAIVPPNQAVCNADPKLSIATYPSYPGLIAIGYIKLPEQACQLMIPALKASGHWGKYFDEIINESDCQHFAGGSTLYYYRSKKW